jgi:hypothetical protein
LQIAVFRHIPRLYTTWCREKLWCLAQQLLHLVGSEQRVLCVRLVQDIMDRVVRASKFRTGTRRGLLSEERDETRPPLREERREKASSERREKRRGLLSEKREETRSPLREDRRDEASSQRRKTRRGLLSVPCAPTHGRAGAGRAVRARRSPRRQAGARLSRRSVAPLCRAALSRRSSINGSRPSLPTPPSGCTAVAPGGH